MGVVTDQKVTQEKVLPYQQHCSPQHPQHPEANLSELSTSGSTRRAKRGSAVGVLPGGGTNDEQAMQGAERDACAQLDASSKDKDQTGIQDGKGCPKTPQILGWTRMHLVGYPWMSALEPFAVVVFLIVITHAHCSDSSNTRGYAMRSKSSS